MHKIMSPQKINTKPNERGKQILIGLLLVGGLLCVASSIIGYALGKPVPVPVPVPATKPTA